MKRIQRLNSQLLWTTQKSCLGFICVLLCMATGIFTLPVQAQECEPHWSDEFPAGFLNGGPVQATTVFDDGSGTGPALYVGGNFETGPDLTLNHMGKLMPNDAWAPLSEGVNGNVFTLVTFDDGLGGGEALYAAGIFSEAGNVKASNIAKWDGKNWSALGEGTNGHIRSLAVFDDGSELALYVGGFFTTAGGVKANNIARWNGDTWSLLGSGIDGIVHVMIVFDDGLGGGPALYVGGSFENAGGVAAHNIAKWDGEEWLPVGGGTNATIRGAMTVFDDGSGPALYVGGMFTEAGGTEALHVAKWDGLEWSPVGGGTDSIVNGLAVYDAGSGEGPALFAIGLFDYAGGVYAKSLARWDGKEWSQVGVGINGLPLTLGVFEDINRGPGLFVGGLLRHAGMVSVDALAKWDGAHWLPVGGGLVGGNLPAIGATLITVEEGSDLDAGLYLGGQFITAGGVWSPRVARLNEGEWYAVGEGIGESSGWVRALALFDGGLEFGPDLYAGGFWLDNDKAEVRGVAKWDGETWSELGLGVDQEVYALTVYDDGLGSGPLLYVAGKIQIAGGEPVSKIATWNGMEWMPLSGGGANHTITVLAVWDDGTGDGQALYVGGGFTTMEGGLQTNHVAKWDGVQWSALGSGTDDWVSSLAVYDDGSGSALYAAGSFSTAGEIQASRIAKWDGKQWSAIPEGGISDGLINSSVSSLQVIDDGLSDHPALYIVGRFQSVGGIDAQNIARWDGMTWSTLGQGLNDNGQGSITRAWAVEIFDDGTGDGPALFATGDFTFAGEHSSQSIAKWVICENSIPGDLDGDGVVTKSDLTILLSNWGPCDDCNNCLADLDNNCVVGMSDLLILFSNWG